MAELRWGAATHEGQLRAQNEDNHYAGDGLFCYSHDMLNMTHIGQTMRDMQWRPEQKINIPPKVVNRDVSLPPAWAHLAKA